MRKLSSSALLLLAGCCVALVLAEGLVRVFAPHSRDHVVPGGLFMTDPALGWTLTPGRDLRHRTRNFDVRYGVNAMGFRDPARQIVNPSASRRVLMFGDSQIFGWGVHGGQRLTDLVETRVSSVEVWNMGVPGYGLDQQLLAYENRTVSLAASAVVFFVSGPTLERTRRAHIYRKPKPRFIFGADSSLKLVPVGGSANVWTGAVYRVLSRFYLPYFLEREWRMLVKGRQEPPRSSTYVFRISTRTIEALPLALLIRAKSTATARHQRFAVLSDLPPRATDQLREFCERNGIDFISTPFGPTTRNYVIAPEDQHWSPQGHELVAGRLAEMVGSWSSPDSR